MIFLKKQTFQKNNKGFFSLGLVLIVLLSFIPVIYYVGNSMENMGTISINYRARIKADRAFNDIKVNFYNFQSCFNSFSKPTKKGKGYTKINKIKNQYNRVFNFNNSGIFRFEFKRAVLCFDKKTARLPECKGTKGTLTTGPKGKTRVNLEAQLYIELYSDWTDELLSKKIPLFLETDNNGNLLSCSTSKPAMTSVICEEVEIKKSCCRYKYSYKFPKVNYLKDSKKKLKMSPPKIVYNGNNVTGFIPSITDPYNKDVDKECENSTRNLKVKAKCLGSSWDYKLECVI